MCSQECNHELLQHLSYLSEDIVKIEEGTREQYTNPNWKSARNGLLTSSNFKTIYHSTDMNNTANNLLKQSTIKSKS
jgi:hypothetical protein